MLVSINHLIIVLPYNILLQSILIDWPSVWYIFLLICYNGIVTECVKKLSDIFDKIVLCWA